MMPSLEMEGDLRALENVGSFRAGLICQICQSFFKNACNIPCGHTFCQACIDTALTDKSMCPDCKNPAWQKDTLKSPQADSAVEEWLTKCEGRYQEIVARVAKANEDDNTTLSDASWGSDQDDADGHDQRRSSPTLRAQAIITNEDSNGGDGVKEPVSSRSGSAVKGAIFLHDDLTIAEPVGASASIGLGTFTKLCMEHEKENLAAPPQGMGSSPPDSALTSATRKFGAGSPMGEAKPPHADKHHPIPLAESALVSPRKGRQEKASVLTKSATPLKPLKGDARSPDGDTWASWKASGKLKVKESSQHDAVGSSFNVLESTVGSPSLLSPNKPSMTPLAARPAVPNEKVGQEKMIFRFSADLPDTCDVTGSPPRSPSESKTKCLIRTPPILKAGLTGAKVGSVLRSSPSNVHSSGALLTSLAGIGFNTGGGGKKDTKAAATNTLPIAGGYDFRDPGNVGNRNDQQATGEPASRCRDTTKEVVGIASPAHAREGARIDGSHTSGESNKEVRNVFCKDHESCTGEGGLLEGAEEGPVDPAGTARANAIGGDVCVTGCADSTGDVSDNDESIPLFVEANGNKPSMAPLAARPAVPNEKVGQEKMIFRFSADLPDTCDVTGSPPRSPSESKTKCLIRTPPILKAGLTGAKVGSVLRSPPSNVHSSGALLTSLAGIGFNTGGGGKKDTEAAATNTLPIAGGYDFRDPGNVGNRNDRQATGEPASRCPDTTKEVVGIASPAHAREGARMDESHTSGESNEEVRNVFCKDHESCTSEGGLLGGAEEGPVDPADTARANAIDDAACVTGCADSTGDVSDNDESIPLFVEANGKLNEVSRATPSQAASLHWREYSTGEVDRCEPTNQLSEKTFDGAAEEQWEGEDDEEETCDEREIEDNIDSHLPFRQPSEKATLRNDPAKTYCRQSQGAGLAIGDVDATGDESEDSEKALSCLLAKGQKQRGTDSTEANFPKQRGTSSEATALRIGSHTKFVDSPRHQNRDDDKREKQAPASVDRGIESRQTTVSGNTAASPTSGKETVPEKNAMANLRLTLSGAETAPSTAFTSQRAVRVSEPAVRGRDKDESEPKHHLETKLKRTLRHTTAGDDHEDAIKLDKKRYKNENKEGDVPGYLVDTLNKVRTTPPTSRRTPKQEESDRCDRTNDATVVCLATQEHSEQEGTTEAVEDRCSQKFNSQNAPHVPETGVESFISQEIPETACQSLCTQEVPETALTSYNQTASSDFSHEESIDSAMPAPVRDSGLSESELPETSHLLDGATQSSSNKDYCSYGGENMSDVIARAGSYDAESQISLPTPAAESVTPRGQQLEEIAADDAPNASGTIAAGALRVFSGVSRRLEGSAPIEHMPNRGDHKRAADKICFAGGISTRAECPEEKPRSISSPLDDPFVNNVAEGDEDRSDRADRHLSEGPAGAGLAEGNSGREFQHAGHDLAAAQDAWQAEGTTSLGYDYDEYSDYLEETGDDDGGRRFSRSVGPTSKRSRQNREVSNPYAPEACLELKPEYDPAPEASEVPGPKRGGEKGSSSGTGGITLKQSSRQPLRRPSSATMSFGAPSQSGAILGPAVLGGATADAQIRERDKLRSSNKILGAGRTNKYERPGTMTMTGSFSSYDLGPDSLELKSLKEALDAKRAKRKPSESTVAAATVESVLTDTINLTGDDDSQGSLKKRSVEDLLRAPSNNKRTKASAWRGRSDAGRTSHRSNGQREVQPVIAVLGCEEWEIERTKLLCKKLGQRHLHLDLVWGVTHVVVGTQHTCDCGGGRDNRHELVRHTIVEYYEAVLRGLWVLDFSWVEACLQERGACEDGRVALSPQTPPRGFELVGCRLKHKGCNPRRGRHAKGNNMAGVFRGLRVCVAGEGESKAEKERVLRLLLIGEAELVEGKPSKAAGSKEAYVDGPFDAAESGEDASDAVDPGKDVTADAATAATEKEMVVVTLSDLPGGRISPRLATRAIAKSEALKARAVDQAWILNSIEQNSLADFDSHSLHCFFAKAMSSLSITGGANNQGGGAMESKGRAKRPMKGRLTLPPETNSRKELFDLDEELGPYYTASAAPGIRKTAKLTKEAEEVMSAADRVNKNAAELQPMGLGADGFAFSRYGSKKKNTQEVDSEPGTGSYTTYKDVVLAQEELCKALYKVGYLNIDDRDEVKISDFWSNTVYHGIFLRRSEIAGKRAVERGCPLNVLRTEYGRHKNLQSEAAEARLNKLSEDYDVWEGPDVGGGKSMKDALEVL